MFPKPFNPKFSTGPTTKRKGYDINKINQEFFGRSHRSVDINNLIKENINALKRILQIPQNYQIILTPASDTGAVEMALWNFVGKNKVDILVWEHFGKLWLEDLKQLQIEDLNIFQAEYGDFPNIDKVDFINNDIIFTYCGTSSGVIFNREDLIPKSRKGLIITDASSMIFSKDIVWEKIDILTFSWQKALGGEAQHGILVLSPNALKRLEEYHPLRAIPKIFQLKDSNHRLKKELWENYQPINTPSIFALCDLLDNLKWIEKSGSLDFCLNKINENFLVMKEWVEESNWVSFLAKDIDYTSKMSICLKIIDKRYLNLSLEKQKNLLEKIHQRLYDENIAYDISSYKKAPLGLRIWAGLTIEKEDLIKLTKWIDYFFQYYIQKI